MAATGTDYAASGGSLTLYFVPDADINGDVTFDYAATDDDGAVDATPATATITVTDVNDGPTTADAAASGAEDASSIPVTITGSDIDGTVDSFSLSSLPTDGTLYTDAGLTTVAVTGTDYAAAGNSLTLYFVPDADFNGDVTFDYAATDDDGAVDATPATATITVTDVNDGPTTNDAVATGAEDASSIPVTITGSDIDGTVDSFSLSSLPTNGTLYTDAGLTTVAATGTDYAAAGGSLTLYFVPDADFNGDVTFDYAATDDDGAVDATPATATITVTDVSDGPTTADAAASGAEDAASISVTITDSDIDGTVDSFSLSSLPTDGTLYTDAGLTTVAATGTDYAAAGGSLTLYFVPDADFNGDVTFDYAATDDDGAVDATPATATITVTDVNDGPTTNDAAASGAEDAASISVTITGSDIDGTVDSFSLSSLPTDGTLYTDAGLTTVAATGTDYAAAGGSLTLYFVPDADYYGDVTFDYAATDDDGAVDATPATATITVTDVNDGPTTADAAASGAEDAASISVTITGSDIDGTVDSFSLSSLPTDGTLYTDAGLTTVAATGTDYAASGGSLTLYFVPDADFNGDVTFDYAATDDDGAVDATPATATITVTDVNDGPTTSDAVASGAEDAASISVTITGSDIDGTVDGFSLSSLPTDGTLYTDAGLTTVAATGTDYAAAGGSLTLYFVPDADFNGDVTFDYAATDDDGAVDATPATATITVTDVVDNIIGTPGDDNIVGTMGADSISGLGGDDTIDGGAGDDTIKGQAGADAIDGGSGIDTATYQGSGQAVNVNLATGTGTGGDAQGDTLTNIENLTGSGRDDTLTGDANVNIIDGAAGDDMIDGGAGDDILIGGAGEDTLIGGAGADNLDGGTGNSDVASYENSASAVNVDLSTGTGTGGDAEGDTLTNIEGLTGSANDDTLIGDAGANVIDGGAGDDSIVGGDGQNTLSGSLGDDTMIGGSDNDEFNFSDNDFNGGVWTDVVDGGADAMDVIDLSDVTQGWTLEVVGEGPGPEASSGDNPSHYTDTDGFSGTITFDDGSTVVFDNIEKVDW